NTNPSLARGVVVRTSVRGHSPRLGLRGGGGLQLLVQARNAAGGRVRVDDVAARRAVQLLLREADERLRVVVAVRDGDAGVTHGAQRAGAEGLVLLGALDGLAHALARLGAVRHRSLLLVKTDDHHMA